MSAQTPPKIMRPRLREYAAALGIDPDLLARSCEAASIGGAALSQSAHQSTTRRDTVDPVRGPRQQPSSPSPLKTAARPGSRGRTPSQACQAPAPTSKT